jgi:two-component system CheB/CheR fusion protein
MNLVLDLYSRQTTSNRISMVKRYEGENTIRAFPEEIHQVFANIVRNAIEAVSCGGTITLHVFAAHQWSNGGRPGSRVVIADTGPGIAPENRDRVFEPFFTTKGENGTGLGLWVSSGIVQKHGGSIRVRSNTHVGQSGTVFNIFLPSDIEHRQAELPSKQTALRRC